MSGYIRADARGDASGARLLDAPLGPGAAGVVSTRLGGASRGAWRWLNLGAGVGDDPEAVEANWRAFCDAAGRERSSLVRVRQVHGDRVLVAGDARPDGRRGADGRPLPEADAVVTRDPDATLVILVADCAPVFLVDAEAGVVGLAHAGWRGTLAGVAVRTLEAMEGLGARAARTRVWVGPHIGACCYEVDEDLAGRFQDAFGEGVVARGASIPARPGHAYLDIGAANRVALARAGVPAEQVVDGGWCTACRTDLFYSHRGEGGRTGRMAAAVWLDKTSPAR